MNYQIRTIMCCTCAVSRGHSTSYWYKARVPKKGVGSLHVLPLRRPRDMHQVVPILPIAISQSFQRRFEALPPVCELVVLLRGLGSSGTVRPSLKLLPRCRQLNGRLYSQVRQRVPRIARADSPSSLRLLSCLHRLLRKSASFRLWKFGCRSCRKHRSARRLIHKLAAE